MQTQTVLQGRFCIARLYSKTDLLHTDERLRLKACAKPKYMQTFWPGLQTGCVYRAWIEWQDINWLDDCFPPENWKPWCIHCIVTHSNLPTRRSSGMIDKARRCYYRICEPSTLALSAFTFGIHLATKPMKIIVKDTERSVKVGRGSRKIAPSRSCSCLADPGPVPRLTQLLRRQRTNCWSIFRSRWSSRSQCHQKHERVDCVTMEQIIGCSVQEKSSTFVFPVVA